MIAQALANFLESRQRKHAVAEVRKAMRWLNEQRGALIVGNADVIQVAGAIDKLNRALAVLFDEFEVPANDEYSERVKRVRQHLDTYGDVELQVAAGSHRLADDVMRYEQEGEA